MSVSALLLGIILSVSTTAFRSVNNHRTAVQYSFEGSNSSQSKSASNYTMLGVSDPQPECEGTSLPCVIEVDGDLQTWLDARTETQIKDQAINTKD